MESVMIDEERIEQLCEKIDKGPHSGGIAPSTQDALSEIERLVGRIVRQYTEPLRRLLVKKRIPDVSRHTCEVYGQTMRIRGIASMCNQGEIEQRERDAKFKVDVPEPMHWPEKGSLWLSARVDVEGRYYKHISCVVSAEDIDAIPITSKSLSKREARMRRLGQWMRLYCNEFRFHIERLWEDGNDLADIDEVTYQDVKEYKANRSRQAKQSWEN
jgi:hypothetical protein